MGDANPICTIGDYSKPSHEGYRNTIGLSVGNNVVPLRSDTIRFNDSLSGTRVGKIKGRTYNLLPTGPVYEAILRKKDNKEGGHRRKLGNTLPAGMDIRLSLASHSYIYPLGIVEDILIEVAEHVYPVDFIILDIKEKEKRPFILGTPFLTMAKAEEKIKLHQEKEMEFDRWKNKNFKNERPTPVKIKDGMYDEGEVTVAKDLWERIQLLMQGTSLTKQERECKLYDVFDKFAHIKGESLHQYYLRFTQLINDIDIYKMKLEQVQVNTKFLNSLPPE
ncbi:zinc finger, CCHC-type containing protein [Tanacetum coccineum]